MLSELRIENLLLIERAELRLGGGLNVFTGETGAGKTVLAHSIDLLLGGRSRRGIVRPGAAEAYVEGLFTLPSGLLERPEMAALRDRLADPDAGEVAIGRRVSPEGRTRAYIDGRSAAAADLQLLGRELVSFYGQHENRKLTLAAAQLDVLDSFAGADHRREVDELSLLHGEASRISAELTELELVDGRRERELGLIEFELAEIEELNPDPAEEDKLTAERARLLAADQLRSAAEGALASIENDETAASSPPGAAASLGEALRSMQAPSGADRDLDLLAGRAEALTIELQDLAGDLRTYAGSLSSDPERIAVLDERLDAYERLKRKHGGSVQSVLEHAERCRVDRDRLAGASGRAAKLSEELEAIDRRRRELAAAVTKSRRSAAPKLAAAVRRGLSGLALEGASFEIEISPVDGGIRSTGADSVEFMIAPNPGIEPAPLRLAASGGELSRVMLALLTAGSEDAAVASERTFVFDEIDAGIGGRTARVVGERLRELGEARQVICITHLPQVAAGANRHFRIAKSSEAERARTEVTELEGPNVVDEICRMLGAEADDGGARRHAEELLAAA